MHYFSSSFAVFTEGFLHQYDNNNDNVKQCQLTGDLNSI